MSFSERLKQAMSRAGYTQNQLSREVGMAQSSVNKLLNGASSSRKTVEIARVLNVDPGWLAEGKGYIDNNYINKHKKAVHPNSVNYYRVDYFEMDPIAGGSMHSQKEIADSIKAIEYNREKALSLFGGNLTNNIKVITVVGDSMAGTINPGDQVFIDSAIRSFSGDGIYVFVFGRTMHVKRLQMVKDQLQVISDNKAYKTWNIEDHEEEKLNILAKVFLKQSIEYSRF